MDSLVKILGELVCLDEVQGRLDARMAGDRRRAVVVDREGARDRELVVVAEVRASEGVLDSLHSELPRYVRIQEWIEVSELPRSALGKVQLGAVREGLP